MGGMLCISPFSDGSLIRSLKECKDEKLSGYADKREPAPHLHKWLCSDSWSISQTIILTVCLITATSGEEGNSHCYFRGKWESLPF